MKRIIYLAVLIFLIFMSSCEIDNYDEPAETLQGALTDSEGNSFITEQPNGFKIRMIEDGSTEPRDFWGKADGTFRNTKIFRAKYKIIPTNGAFFPLDTVEVEIKGETTLNFVVTPYLTIDATFEQDGSNIKATYKIDKASGAGKITSAWFLVSKWNPNLGMNYSDYRIERDLSAISDEDIVNTEYTDEITDCLVSGATYYARMAVLAENSVGRYNFSTVQEIVVP